MTTITSTNLTLIDIAKRMDPDGSISNILELLAQNNPIVQHAVAVEGNLPTGHRFTYRTALPTVSLRQFNSGVVPSKSLTAQADESCSMIEAYSEVDVDLAKLNGNVQQTRWSEDQSFIQAMNHEFARLLFKGDPGASPMEFRGLEKRYTAAGDNCIVQSDVTASETDCTSFWWVCWGDNSVFVITPKGSPAGLQVTDLGEQTVGDSTNGYWQAYRSHFQWKVGLGVKDWRQVCRAQFEKSDITAGTVTAKKLLDVLAQGWHRIYNRNAGRMAGYCSRYFYEQLHIASMERVVGSTLTMEYLENGAPIMKVFGTPVYPCDALTETETSLA